MIIYHYTTPTETLQAFNGRVWATPVANADGDELQQLPWGEADALATAVSTSDSPSLREAAANFLATRRYPRLRQSTNVYAFDAFAAADPLLWSSVRSAGKTFAIGLDPHTLFLASPSTGLDGCLQRCRYGTALITERDLVAAGWNPADSSSVKSRRAIMLFLGTCLAQRPASMRPQGEWLWLTFKSRGSDQSSLCVVPSVDSGLGVRLGLPLNKYALVDVVLRSNHQHTKPGASTRTRASTCSASPRRGAWLRAQQPGEALSHAG